MKKPTCLLALLVAASFLACKKDTGSAPSSPTNAGNAGSVYSSGDIYTVVGDGTQGYSGDGGQATSAELWEPYGVAVDASGNVYIADEENQRIRKVNTSGIISTIAGSGPTGSGSYSGDGGPATAARLANPSGVTVDASGNIYIADEGNERIRKVNTSGIISTVAGNGNTGYSGDGSPATAAELFEPWSVAVDGTGNIYIADVGNNRIRKVNTNGIISTIAGNGTAGYSGDSSEATAAELHAPFGVTVDVSGNIYIADDYNYCIRKVNTSGIISTFAGNGTGGFSGDGGIATSAELDPMGVYVDEYGNVYIADNGNNRIRMVNTSGMISTIAGSTKYYYYGDNGPANSAGLYLPGGVAVDNYGNVYIADTGDKRIRKVYK